jgi:phosphate transport system substrate-binding protein
MVILAINASCSYIRVNSCALLTDKTITINGSTAFAPFVQDVANEYQRTCFGPRIMVNTGKLPQGSVNGVQQVEQGAIDIGTSDVFANPTQYHDLQDYQAAAVVFALVVNNSVDLTNLTTDQIRKIYNGYIVNWRDAGNSKDLDIVRVSRPPTSGTRLTFEKYVLDGVETISGPQSLMTDTSSTVALSVKTQEGAIGYVSLYYARKYGLKILSIDGQNPNDSALVLNGSYKFWNIEHMYVKGVASGPVKDFIQHIFSDAAKQIIHADAYLNPADFPRAVLINHIVQV